MEYNVGKCEVIHFGRNNSKMDYNLNGKKLQHAAVQRDLGVLVQESQGVGLQVQQVIKKANRILSFIARGMEFKNSEIMLQLYKVLVRPHLEYCVQFWSSHLRKDILALEGLQRRFTRLIPELRGLAYEERLSRLGLYSLEFRRIEGRSYRNI